MKCMENMNVIAKISCYFERSAVALKLRKEYLNTVAYNTPVLLRIKYWTIWYIERYSTSTYAGVSNFQKTVRFFLAHPVYTDTCMPLSPSTIIYYYFCLSSMWLWSSPSKLQAASPVTCDVTHPAEHLHQLITTFPLTSKPVRDKEMDAEQCTVGRPMEGFTLNSKAFIDIRLHPGIAMPSTHRHMVHYGQMWCHP